MKIPFDLRCDKCGRNLHADLDIARPNPDIVCPCGKMKLRCLVGSTGPDSYPIMVLDRAGYELQRGDNTMAILLSAIAVEIIPGVFASHWKPPVALPDNVIARISKICREYYPMGVEHFVSREHRLNKWLAYDFRTDALQLFGHPRAIIRKIYNAIFQPRNAILHEGKFSYSAGVATKAWNIAVFFYRMVRAMEVMKSYEANPESLDSLFRRAEEELPPSPTVS